MEGHKLHEKMWNEHLVPNAEYFKYLAKTEVALQTMGFFLKNIYLFIYLVAPGLIYLFIFIFIFGCVGSSFLCEGFL